jgi:signal transduction histidine kinase
VEVDQRDASGTTVLRFGLRPLRHDQSSGVLVTIEDITQQRNAEASRNSFIAQATHELRTPLTNIMLYLETAQADGEKDPAIRAKCLNVIGQEARRLERTVGEMLSVAQIEAGCLELKKDDVRLDKLFGELEADYRAQAQAKSQDLRFDLPPKLPVIQADHDKLAATIHNLIGNALKYTPAGGKVVVSVRVEGKLLQVDVSDTGIGIEEKEKELIFARFYRAKDARVAKITGSGLGLALAREVARLHGGDVSVESRLDKGSTFTLTLPLGEASV